MDASDYKGLKSKMINNNKLDVFLLYNDPRNACWSTES